MLDVTQTENISAALQEAIDKFGKIDLEQLRRLRKLIAILQFE